jgi:hypothetical protein
MLIIPLLEKEIKPAEKTYYKTRSRLSTVTDINIISNELVVIIHRFSKKVFLVKIKPKQEPEYEIIDNIQLNYQTEMLTRKDNRLYIITFTEYLVIVDIIDNKLKFIKEIKLVEGSFYHGLEINNDYLYIVPSVVKNNFMHIIKFSLETHKIEKIITPEFKENTGKYRLKDISFLPNGNILLLVMINNGKTNMTNVNHIDKGFIGLYDMNFILIDKYEMNEIHIDSLITHNNNFYLTIEENEGGFIYKGSVNNQKNIIENMKKIKVDVFPHGIDINKTYNLFGFTSYATSSAYLLSLDELDELEELNL